MRTFAVIAVVCIAFLPRNTGAGFVIDWELDLAGASDATAGAPVPPANRGPFTAWWEEKGIEEITNVFAGYTGGWHQKPPVIEPTKIFVGMWTPRASDTVPTSRYHSVRVSTGYAPVPSTIPPFETGALAVDLWPRTRTYLSSDYNATTDQMW